MNGTALATFDPRPYLRKLNGKDYLEVVHRLQWLRSEHPEAIISTSLLHLDWEAGYAVFHARVEIPGAGIAEGTGSETRQGFPAGWLEKAETIAIGRALAALGYGTAFCLDFDTLDEAGNGHLADSPVERPAPRREQSVPRSISSGLATPAQLKLLYIVGTRDAHLTEEELDEQCQARYGRLPLHLTKSEASELIDSLRATNGMTKVK